MNKINQGIFRAYDIRGKYPEEINEETAYSIGRGFAKTTGVKNVVVGRDIRDASEKMMSEVIRGLINEGVRVTSVGRIANDMLSFAVCHYNFDGGIILSASHNPVGYGGMKMMIANAVTIPGNDPTLMKEISESEYKAGETPKVEEKEIFNDYLDFVFKFIDKSKLVKQKILFDPLYGSCGMILKKAISDLPVEPIFLHENPDKNFGGLSEPNPLNLEINKFAVEKAGEEKVDFGVIWDGDADRCFFIDEKGEFVPAPYITALLVKNILKKIPGSNIVGDPRIVWPIEKSCEENGGTFVPSKSGYRFIKEKMKETDAVFGGEMTAHYFFRDNYNSDNGFIPFLLVWEMISESGQTLSDLIAPYKENHFLIDEIKVKVSGQEDVGRIIENVKSAYKDFDQNELDGVTIESSDFRINVRASNTEPVLRANMEAMSEEILESEKNKLVNLLK